MYVEYPIASAKRRFVLEKKLVKANIPATMQPTVQIKFEPADFKNMPMLNSANQLPFITSKSKLVSKKMVVYMCKQCNIYFPIQRMLELHNKSTHPKEQTSPTKACQGYYKDAQGKFNCQYCRFSSTIRSSVASHSKRRHASLIKAQLQPAKRIEIERTVVIVDETENNEDDENSWEVETLDENLPVLAKIKEMKCEDPSKLAELRECPFCSFSSDNPSTHRSHVKRKHFENWFKLHAKEKSSEEKTPKGHPQQENSAASEETEKPTDDTSSPAPKVAKIRSCPHCPFKAIAKSTLYSHINRSHKGKRISARLRQLAKDIGEISGKRHDNAFAHTGYACSYCTFAAATMSSLRYHTAREHGDQRQPVIEFPVGEFDCDQCDYKSVSRKDMQHHVKNTHLIKPNAEGLFACHLCSYESLSRMGVQRHISVKHDKQRREAKAGAEPKVFVCENCHYNTFNAKILEWHKKQHDADARAEDDGNAYYCNDCDFATWTKAQLFTHIKRNHREEEAAQEKKSADATDHATDQMLENHYVCDRCDYTSKNKHVMKVHVIRKHTEDFNHACELCGKKYKVKADLTNHMRFQHREQPIICDVCGKTCRNSNLLYLHQKFAHYKPEFECHICHRRMVSQANLDDHIFKQHEQRQDVICEECGKTFTRQSRLKIHMRTHLGLRPYTCHICGKAFARKNGLRQHLLLHTGQRPYICDICGKDFTQKTGLISHRKSHPGSHPPLPRVYIDQVLSSLNENKP